MPVSGGGDKQGETRTTEQEGEQWNQQVCRTEAHSEGWRKGEGRNWRRGQRVRWSAIVRTGPGAGAPNSQRASKCQHRLTVPPCAVCDTVNRVFYWQWSLVSVVSVREQKRRFSTQRIQRRPTFSTRP